MKKWFNRFATVAFLLLVFIIITGCPKPTEESKTLDFTLSGQVVGLPTGTVKGAFKAGLFLHDAYSISLRPTLAPPTITYASKFPRIDLVTTTPKNDAEKATPVSVATPLKAVSVDSAGKYAIKMALEEDKYYYLVIWKDLNGDSKLRLPTEKAVLPSKEVDKVRYCLYLFTLGDTNLVATAFKPGETPLSGLLTLAATAKKPLVIRPTTGLDATYKSFGL